METVELAIRAINSYTEFAKEHGTSNPVSQVLVQEAHAYALIAQAEQLKRIADALDAVSANAEEIGETPYKVVRVDSNWDL